VTDVPVCAGRGSQPRCKHYKANGSEPAVRWCMALYNVVTGEPAQRYCEDVRGDQALCGRQGVMYEPVAASGVAVDGKALRSHVRQSIRADLG